MELKNCKGKTIAKIEEKTFRCADDMYVIITFTDGTKCKLIPAYSEYTGKSYNEYPCYLTTK